MTSKDRRIIIEVEIKATTPPNIHSALESLNAKISRKAREINTIFNHKERDLFKSNEIIRVREEKTDDKCRTILTYKKGISMSDGLKSAEEINIDVTPNITQFLEALGFYPAVVYHKTRERWDVGNVEVAVDSVDELGEFVELESRGATEHELRCLASKLGITSDMLVNSTYPELVMEKLKNK